jgi:hypothetical protein
LREEETKMVEEVEVVEAMVEEVKVEEALRE